MSPSVPRLILASASPRRADVLRQLGLTFSVEATDVEETRHPGEEPEGYVERLARTKAGAVAADHPDAVVVGGDTVVVAEGRVLQKPENPGQAVDMLAHLAGGSHEVLTGLAVAWRGELRSGVATARVGFRAVDRRTLEAYVATGEPMDKAGGYGIQGLGAALVAGIEGDYYTVVGQPVGLLLELVEHLGLRYDFAGALVPTSSSRP